MIQIQVVSDHPIVFLYDPGNEHMVVPAHENGKLVDCNQSCIAIGTRFAREGATELVLANEILNPEGQLVFEGSLHLPSQLVSINTSEREDWGNIKVGSTEARVRIWANDASEPSKIVVEAR